MLFQRFFTFGGIFCPEHFVKDLDPLALYSIDTHFNASTTDSFLKHCWKRRNCS